MRTNSARVTSQLVSCFARADAAKTLDRFFRLCDRRIRQELESGAGSTRSTRTDHAIESDTTLNWWIGLLTGAVTNAGEQVRPLSVSLWRVSLPLTMALLCTPQILKYKDELKSLIQTMVEHCKSERGYTTTARILAITLMTLTNTWVRDYRSVNADEWNDPGTSAAARLLHACTAPADGSTSPSPPPSPSQSSASARTSRGARCTTSRTSKSSGTSPRRPRSTLRSSSCATLSSRCSTSSTCSLPNRRSTASCGRPSGSTTSAACVLSPSPARECSRSLPTDERAVLQRCPLGTVGNPEHCFHAAAEGAGRGRERRRVRLRGIQRAALSANLTCLSHSQRRGARVHRPSADV